MSEEELNKKMEFIVEQQAQFTADIQVMREVHAADTDRLKEETRQLKDAIITIVGLVGGIAQAQTRTDARVADLVVAQTRTDEKLAELAERLNVFIGVVERHIGGNGNKPSEGRP
jgi:hypothetical protein